MSAMHVDIKAGFRKGNINNLPTLTNKSLYDFITKMVKPEDASMSAIMSKYPAVGNDLHVDYVQVRQTDKIIDIKAVVFSIDSASPSKSTTSTILTQAHVHLKVGAKNVTIIGSFCDLCNPEEACVHVTTFLFWLHRQTADADKPAVVDFWGQEAESFVNVSTSKPIRLSDVYPKDPMSAENAELKSVTMEEGTAFLNAILEKMDDINLKNSIFYAHCRPTTNVFETIFIHHVLLDADENGVKSIEAFVFYMREQSNRGMFDQLFDVSKDAYKTPLWFEAQYMRLRCSNAYRINSRVGEKDTEQILKSLFCKKRTSNIKEKQKAKQRKRFILKQTEKLENKHYQYCGIILNKNYPYLCATPDGITDDHIVEIKVPKTDADYELYLQRNETVAPKYMAQLQLQMYMANVPKALYCVISPNFDVSGALHYVWVQADGRFVGNLLNSLDYFWKNVVYPRLAKSYARAR